MKLNHLNLTVDDVPAARRFLVERHFGLRPAGEGHKNFDMLLDDDGLRLTLMGVGHSNTVSYPRTFHLGFIRPSRADVDEINERLKGDGLDVDAPSLQHGAWAFSFLAPGGFTIAVRSQETLAHPDSPVGDQEASSSRHSSARHEAKHRWRH